MKRIPSYRRHKASGQAVVTLSGKDVYLGPYNSPKSRSKYDAEISAWLARGRVNIPGDGCTVAELAVAYSGRSEAYYLKQGLPTDSLRRARRVAAAVRARYGDEPVAEFTPGKLVAMRQWWIDAGLSRGTVNHYAMIVKDMFRWGVEVEMVPASALAGLDAVRGIGQGRSKAPEGEPVGPADRRLVRISRRFLNDLDRRKVLVQLLTGMRPNEACGLRPSEVDRGDPSCWVYRPEWHKTQHRGKGRTVVIGPRAARVLAPLMGGDPDRPIFAPRGDGPTRTPPRMAATYGHAVNRACRKASPHPTLAPSMDLTPRQAAELRAWDDAHRWSPNQLRHNAATAIRRAAGLESARIALGHSSANMTEVYAEKDIDSIKDLMRRIG